MHVGRMRSRFVVVASAVRKNRGWFQSAGTLLKVNELCGGRGRRLGCVTFAGVTVGRRHAAISVEI